MDLKLTNFSPLVPGEYSKKEFINRGEMKKKEGREESEMESGRLKMSKNSEFRAFALLQNTFCSCLAREGQEDLCTLD